MDMPLEVINYFAYRNDMHVYRVKFPYDEVIVYYIENNNISSAKNIIFINKKDKYIEIDFASFSEAKDFAKKFNYEIARSDIEEV